MSAVARTGSCCVRSILFTALFLLLLTGCQNLDQANDDWNMNTPVIVELEQVIYWLQAANDALEISPQQAELRLSRITNMRKTRFNTFRYALLNQQLGTRDGWERARDTLRELAQDRGNNEDLLWIIRIHLHNVQGLINNHEKYHKLAAELSDSRQMQLLLEDKIQALTNLEQSISERKEQVSEDVKTNGVTNEQK